MLLGPVLCPPRPWRGNITPMAQRGAAHTEALCGEGPYTSEVLGRFILACRSGQEALPFET